MPISFRRACSAAVFLAAVTCAHAVATFADDWPQYRGPGHDGATPEPISTDWTGGKPRELWRVPAGEAFGSFAAVGDRVFAMMERGGTEACVALNAADGKELWAATIDRTIFERQGGNGPRTTPAVAGGKVYVLGTYLKLQCLNASDGKPVWTHDLAAEFGAKEPGAIKKWGNAASPVVVGDKVIVAGGGAGQAYLAFDKESGKLAWKTGGDSITHATPTPATIHGVEQVIFFMEQGLVSLSPTDGKELWRWPFKFNVSTASSPIVGGDVVYASAGYGVGGGAARIMKDGDGFKATELWKDAGLPNHWTTPVCLDGHVYGIVGFKQFANAPLKCVEIATGKVKWEQPGFGSGGATILAGGKLIVQHDTGQVTLVDPNPEAYKELGKVQPLTGKCWTMPAVANGRLFCRSVKEIVALDVSK
jgi:outer membrane protein assembly factor BamB